MCFVIRFEQLQADGLLQEVHEGSYAAQDACVPVLQICKSCIHPATFKLVKYHYSTGLLALPATCYAFYCNLSAVRTHASSAVH
jgi:hypothetical protein